MVDGSWIFIVDAVVVVVVGVVVARNIVECGG